jgi:4-diphosphocytidyl-2-C-methyl-D-erythritol kinase
MSDGNTAAQWVPTGSVTVRVPGKVNLYLAVGDRREDGYHELTTVFQAVSLLDEVTVREADVLSLELVGEGADTLPTDERNLAWRAAELMADHVGRAPDVSIFIDKSIPVAGGMAGGSADAAAVLVAMNSLWELNVPRRDLRTLAARLGSDVPFALHGGTALGTGRGEELATVLSRNTFHWVLAFADSELLTPAVYTELDRLREAGDPERLAGPGPVLAALAAGDAEQLAPLLGNEMQAAALSMQPGLPCAPAWKPVPWRASCPVPDRRVPSCAPRRPRRSTSAPSCRGRGCAARCGSPTGRRPAPGWYRRPPKCEIPLKTPQSLAVT